MTCIYGLMTTFNRLWMVMASHVALLLHYHIVGTITDLRSQTKSPCSCAYIWFNYHSVMLPALPPLTHGDWLMPWLSPISQVQGHLIVVLWSDKCNYLISLADSYTQIVDNDSLLLTMSALNLQHEYMNYKH